MNNNNVYSYPSSLKKLRACTGCHLVKTEEQVKSCFNIVLKTRL